MGSTFDVIVVGGGYIGSSVACHLSRAGLRTALLDQGGFAAGASRANFGNIQIQDLELNKSFDMIRTASTRFEKLEAELDRKVGLRRLGSLLLIENEQQWKLMETRLEALHLGGIPSELVAARRLGELEPLIDPSPLLGALYHAREGQVDPFLLINAYLVQARRRGLQEFYFTEVTGFSVHGGRLQGVLTSQGRFSTAQVVLCTGAHTRRLGMLLGREWDIPYVLGQAMVTEPIRPILHNHISSASFFEQAGAGNAETIGVGLAVSQSHQGQMLLGEALVAADAFQRQVPRRALGVMAECVLRHFPSFCSLRVQRSWSAPVAYTSDSCPWLGPVQGIEGLLIATAFRSTVIVTPLIGETVAQLVTSGKCDLIIDDFLPERNRGHAQ
ncbi:MAG TPA: FAD-binding oxidoreductase [Anaerolineales bacterium]|nr:FAD-binding oxidoreductase [Anaerolineales bacterium]